MPAAVYWLGGALLSLFALAWMRHCWLAYRHGRIWTRMAPGLNHHATRAGQPALYRVVLGAQLVAALALSIASVCWFVLASPESAH